MTKRPQQGVAQHGVTLVVRWAIVGALTVLLISMATGQYGISNYVALQRNKDELERANMKLLVENQLIDEKIETLRTSKAAQLHYLKDVFGYVEKESC